MTLPSADHQAPACGACHGETSFDGDDFVCYDCHLAFGKDTLDVRFLDPDAEVCGAPCANTWHDDNAITVGQGFNCHPCQLPKGHDHPAWFHWTGCEPITLTPPAPAIAGANT
ncbi:hypothetical protein SEA_RUTHY_61 [Gordonia phage Ruthy]|uniref:Uncharacterized protein n=1 Tax=Gordonia phage Ruthy TaxID=2250323 RepID=A0A345L5H2_9CAUD|nr:hypothetical protein HOT73_gp61 [Gordonia phage Ruthy]AXH50524.1 hypothetical protein SEA_RUTHY_61 [Gordonia phage Ruthy]